MPQEAAALRYAEADRMPDFRPLRQQRVVGALVTQERDQVAHRGEADAEQLRVGRLVPQLVNLERVERAPLWQQPDRAVVDELPFLPRDVAPPVALAVADDEARFGLVERGGGVAETAHDQLGGAAGTHMELVADAPGNRVAVFQWKGGGCPEPGIGAGARRGP